MEPPCSTTTDCAAHKAAGQTTSGTYSVSPRGSKTDSACIRVYCDMTTSPPGQSLFSVSTSGISLSGSPSCVMNYENDDMDSTLMWVDLKGKVMTANSQDATLMNWMTLPRDGTSPSTSQHYIWGSASEHWPSSLSSLATPVPFPGAGTAAGIVVWFDTSHIRFRTAQDGSFEFTYPSAMSSCLPDLTDANKMVWVTDGVNTVLVGKYDDTRQLTSLSCAYTLTFDWSAAAYTSSMVTATSAGTPTLYLGAHSNHHATEEDSMKGDLLWTVNGKPSFFSSGSLHLGTSMTNPFTATLSSALSGIQASSQEGTDIFMRVDTSNNLWVGDWGHDNGGLFGCATDAELGIQMTNIVRVE